MESTSHLTHLPSQTTAGSSPEVNGGSRKSPVKFGRTTIEQGGRDIGIFTMTLEGETINMLPSKAWGQLDVHKWVPRGKLPGTPPGLEITPDHVKIAGQIIRPQDPDGCEKLAKLIEEWLALERETLELARKKAQGKLDPQSQKAKQPGSQALHFRVEIDKVGQVHVRCLQGEETLVVIGLNLPGFKSLISQGLMRKPQILEVGALHDWVKFDDVIFSFEKGRNDASSLEAALNQKYLVATALGTGKDVLVFANSASATGFDIQFPVRAGGVQESRRRPLNEESLELLQDRDRCGLLHQTIVIKLSRPTLIFKQKTPDGGERYLNRGPDNLVLTKDEDGNDKLIDLSRPVNYMQLGPLELTAVFNHPAIHKHGKITARADAAMSEIKEAAAIVPRPTPEQLFPATAPLVVSELVSQLAASEAPAFSESKSPTRADEPRVEPVEGPAPAAEQGEEAATELIGPPPNLWLGEILAQPPLEHKWFSCLAYARIAEYFGNSHDGTLGQSACWDVTLDEVEDIEDPDFMGFFLTEKGGFGFLNHGCLARFNDGVVFLGSKESGIEGIDIHLIAVGIDAEGRAVFVVTDRHPSKFGVPDQTVDGELKNLEEYSILLMSVSEVLDSPVPLDIVWTVPREQANPDEPQAMEYIRSDVPEAESVPLVDV